MILHIKLRGSAKRLTLMKRERLQGLAVFGVLDGSVEL